MFSFVVRPLERESRRHPIRSAHGEQKTTGLAAAPSDYNEGVLWRVGDSSY
jgi:hypothetical protein